MNMRIAVVQQDHNPGRPGENRRKAVGFGRDALEQGAELILFHEELLIGLCDNPHDLAEPADGETSQAFISLLRKVGGDARIVYGANERDGGDYYIAAPILSAEGVVDVYRKTHLWCDTDIRHEPAHYEPGDRLVIFEHKGRRIGVMICYDGDYPEMTRAYARKGCDMVLWMNNRHSRGPDETQELVNCNSIVLAATCNCGIDEAGRVCRGGSHIRDADGTVLGERWDEEGFVLADVDLSRVAAMREKNPRFNNYREDLYGPASVQTG